MKAEDFIDDCTKRCSNEAEWNYQSSLSETRLYQSWLTPDEALRAVEIAREETIKEVCEWIEENIGEYCDGENIMFSAIHIENIDVFGQESFIDDLRKAMKDE